MEVNPERQNINQLFSTTQFDIDFYQREYKWKEHEVKQLLEDIFYHFEPSYSKHKDLDAEQHHVTTNYSWYYLNTYVTNKASGKVFVVDGQQRLTTLTLMLIALYQFCAPQGLDSPKMREWLKVKIAGVGIGGKTQFWMAHDKRDALMQALFAGTPPHAGMISDGVTARNIIDNYALIQRELLAKLPCRAQARYLRLLLSVHGCHYQSGGRSDGRANGIRSDKRPRRAFAIARNTER